MTSEYSPDTSQPASDEDDSSAQSPPAVPTLVADVSGMRFADVMQVPLDTVSGTVTQLLERIATPGRSISGYNPQRLDDS